MDLRENLVTFYTDILKALGADVIEESAFVSFRDQPVTVEKKRLALPTRAVMKTLPNSDDVIGFHPLCENIARGESPVLRRLRRMIASRMNVVVSTLMLELTAIAVDRDSHEKLTMKQSAFLDVMPDANKKTYKAVTSLISNAVKKSSSILSIYLKRGGQIDGKGYHRVCTVKCNLHAELIDPEIEKPFGVTMSKKDRAAITALLETILPQLADNSESVIRVGSKSPLAPYFQCLLLTFVDVMEGPNKMIWLMRKHLEDHAAIYSKLSDDTIESIGKLAQFRDVIPSLPGNEGVSVDGAEDAKPVAKETGAPKARKESARDAAKRAAAEAATEEVTLETAKRTKVADDDTPPWEEDPAADGSDGVVNWRSTRAGHRRELEREPESTGSWRDRGRSAGGGSWGERSRWGSNAMGRNSRHDDTRYGTRNTGRMRSPRALF